MTSESPAIGHNNPPSDLEISKERMEESTKALRERTAELATGLARVSETIDNEEAAAKVTDFLAQVAKHEKILEAARKEEKKPFDALADQVQSYFRSLTSMLTPGVEKARKKLTAFQVELKRKEDERIAKEQARIREEQRVKDEAARRAQEEAAAAARAANTEAQRKAAEQLAEDARVAAEAAATAAKQKVEGDQGRVRGDYGAMSYIKTYWDMGVSNPMAIPRQFLMIDEAAVRAEVKRQTDAEKDPSIPGLIFTKRQESIVKSA